jgi:hypothetical protein
MYNYRNRNKINLRFEVKKWKRQIKKKYSEW